MDQRPAVRKSAGQTLFSTVSAHGGLLQQETWKKVLWQVRQSKEIKTIFSLINAMLFNTPTKGSDTQPLVEREKQFECLPVEISRS